MIHPNEDLIRAGGAVVFLRAYDKRPVDNSWTSAPTLTWEQALTRFEANPKLNLGVRLGKPTSIGGYFLIGIDLDIRDERYVKEAFAALLRIFGKVIESFGTVRSGRGNSSRHFYFRCRVALRTGKIARSEHTVKGADGKTRPAWEIDIGGTGRQFVLPPSIHPISRKPYTWENKVDWLDLPVIEVEIALSWYPAPYVDKRPLQQVADDFDAWWAEEKKHPRFFSSEVEDILDRLASTEASRAQWVDDREGWLKIGFALHNWGRGSDKAYELWCAFSGQSDKFDEADNWRVWRSMDKGGASKNPLTMKTLYNRSNEVLMGVAYSMDDRYAEARAAAAALDPRDDDFDVAKRLSRQRAVARRREIDELLDGPVFDVSANAEGGDANCPPITDDDLQFFFGEMIAGRNRELRRQEEAAEKQWEHELERTDTDVIKSGPNNINLIVANDPLLKGVIAYNEFTSETVYAKPFTRITFTMSPMPLRDPRGDRWTDGHDKLLKAYLCTPKKGERGGYGMKPAENMLGDAVYLAGLKNRFHPVREWLSSLRWDGLSRMDSVFCHYLGCPDEPYFREVNRIYCLAAVARIFTPGCKFDFVPVLEGGEGIGKSTFVRLLAYGWFGELKTAFSDTAAMVEAMKNVWQGEFPEMSSLTRSDATDAKAFVSCQVDQVRLAYDRRVGVYPRQCVFIGTTNEPTYLSSENGNRRWFPIPVAVKMVDFASLKAEVPQIWAEAVATYKAEIAKLPPGETELPLYLREAASIKHALSLQAQRKKETAADYLFELIYDFVNTPGTKADMTGDRADEFEKDGKLFVHTRIDTATVWERVMGNKDRTMDNGQPQVIANALSKLGWAKDRRRLEGRFVSWYTRPKTHPRDVALGYAPAPEAD